MLDTYIFRVAGQQLKMNAAKCCTLLFNAAYLLLTIVNLLLYRTDVLPNCFKTSDLYESRHSHVSISLSGYREVIPNFAKKIELNAHTTLVPVIKNTSPSIEFYETDFFGEINPDWEIQ